MFQRLYPLLALIACTFVPGCGDGKASLIGQVLVDGQPAGQGLSLQFSPIDGSSPSYAATDENGNYEAEFTFQTKGIIPGEHSVKLMPGGGESTMPVPGSAAAKDNSQSKAFPKSYYEEIQKIEVESGSNKINFELNKG